MNHTNPSEWFREIKAKRRWPAGEALVLALNIHPCGGWRNLPSYLRCPLGKPPPRTWTSAWSSRFGVEFPMLGPAPVCVVICCTVRGCHGMNPARAAILGSDSFLLSSQQRRERKYFLDCHCGYSGGHQAWAGGGGWCRVGWTWDGHRSCCGWWCVAQSCPADLRQSAGLQGPGTTLHPVRAILHLLWYGNNVNVTIEAEDQIEDCKSE